MIREVRQKIKKFESAAKITRHRRNTFFLSLIALIVAAATMFSVTFSWFSTKQATLDAIDYKLNCGKGLRVNDSGMSNLHYSTNDRKLIPASSVDGRNIFFPTDGSDFSSTTNLMTFRSANVGDKNVNYIQIDASLTAQQNHTSIYLDTSEDNDGPRTALMVKPSGEASYSTAKAAPLRMAIWTSTAEDGVPNTPIVFNPLDKTVTTGAVSDVDRTTGAYISNSPQVAYKFSEYESGKKPLATLSKGVETKVTIIIWLEGTDPKCTDKVRDSEIKLRLAFTTSWDNTKTIRFKDETTNNWVSDLLNNSNPRQRYSLELHYDENISNGVASGDRLDFNMYEYENRNDEWACNIPGDMQKYITFVLRPPANQGTVYRFTVDSKASTPASGGNSAVIVNTYDRGANRLYIADGEPFVLDNYDTCQGYWKPLGDSDGGGHEGGGDFDGDDF